MFLLALVNTKIIFILYFTYQYLSYKLSHYQNISKGRLLKFDNQK